MTHQSFRDDADINNIVANVGTLELAPGQGPKQPLYGDFSEVEDFQTSLEVVRQAQEQFDSLEGAVRARFGNNPAQFLDFVHNPANRAEMVSLGLAKERPVLEKKTPAKAGVPAVGEGPAKAGS